MQSQLEGKKASNRTDLFTGHQRFNKKVFSSRRIEIHKYALNDQQLGHHSLELIEK